MLEKSQSPRLFSSIARRYDLLNHVLSANVDRRWRRALVDMAEVTEGAAVLDVATGTADVAIEFARRTHAGWIVALDRSTEMLAVGRAKAVGARLSRPGRIVFVEADALEMPFGSEEFDVVTIAFGLRNLPDYARGIGEMTRVLKRRGRLLVLEFFPPGGGWFQQAYLHYLRTVVPVTGRIVSGSHEAYRYLSHSIRTFIPREDIVGLMEAAGLEDIRARRLLGGVSDLYRGVKP